MKKLIISAILAIGGAASAAEPPPTPQQPRCFGEVLPPDQCNQDLLPPSMRIDHNDRLATVPFDTACIDNGIQLVTCPNEDLTPIVRHETSFIQRLAFRIENVIREVQAKSRERYQ